MSRRDFKRDVGAAVESIGGAVWLLEHALETPKCVPNHRAAAILEILKHLRIAQGLLIKEEMQS